MHSFFLSIFILLITSQLQAEILKKVEVTGNKRTTIEAIVRHGQIKTGQEFNEKELEIIKKNLGRINQIHVKSIDFSNGILKIEIEDKWTLFPVPMFTKSGNYSNRGVLIYEDNFLGSLGTLASGISWANSILNYIIYYQEESLFSPQVGIKLLLLKKSESVEFSRSNNVIDEHESRYQSYILTPNYLYKNQVFKAGPIFTNKTIYKNNKIIMRDNSKGIFFRHHLNAFQTLDVMYEGLITTYDFYALKNQSDKTVCIQEANIIWSHPYNLSFLNLGFHGHMITEKDYLFGKNLGGEEGYRGYDKASLPASENIGGLVQYQQHLFNRFFISPFYEYNKSKVINQSLNGNIISESTIGIGLRYYFKKISIPAVIFDAARNIDDHSNHFHINIGVSI